MNLNFLNFAPRDEMGDLFRRWLQLISMSIPETHTLKSFILRKDDGFKFFILLNYKNEQYISEYFIYETQCTGKERAWQKRVFQNLIENLLAKIPTENKIKPFKSKSIDDILNTPISKDYKFKVIKPHSRK